MMLSQIFVVKNRSFLVTIEEIVTSDKMPAELEDDIQFALEDLVANEGTVPDIPDFPA